MFSFIIIIILGILSFLLSIYLIYCIISIHQDTKTIADFCVWFAKNKKD